MVNLVVTNPLSQAQQPVRDADGNISKLWLSTSNTGISPTSLFYLGDQVGGEWIQNVYASDPSRYGLAFFGGGAAIVTMLSGGNVGIGTSTPSVRLDVAGDATVSGIATIGGNASIAGSLGLGTTTPSVRLDVVGNANVSGIATIQSDLGVGTTSPTARLDVVGDAKVSGAVRVGTDLTVIGATNLAGTVTIQNLTGTAGVDLVVGANGVVGTQMSSARFKENIRKFTTDFSRVLGLNPVAFTYKQTKDETVGYLAEDVASQGLDELVTRDGDGKPASVHYKLISVYLVELVKQQQAMIEALQEKMSKVEKRFAGDASPATT